MKNLSMDGYTKVSRIDVWFKRLFRLPHVFAYRNPYSRFCIKCGLCQDAYAWKHSGRFAGWEVMYPLAKHPERCGSNSLIKAGKKT